MTELEGNYIVLVAQLDTMADSDSITTLEEMSLKAVKSAWRREVHKITSFTCTYCGVTPSQNLDHIVPKHRGGCNSPHNLIAVCFSCNRSKGNQLFSDWYPKQDFYCPMREAAVMAWLQGDQSLAIEIGRQTVERLNQSQLEEAIERWRNSYPKAKGKQKGSRSGGKP